MTRVIASPYALFGPQQPGWTGSPNGQTWIGSGNTTSIKNIPFRLGFAPVVSAEWDVVWDPSAEAGQVIECIYAPTDYPPGVDPWQALHYFPAIRGNIGDGWGPRTDRWDCSGVMEQFRINQQDIYVGFRVWANGYPMTVTRVNLVLYHETAPPMGPAASHGIAAPKMVPTLPGLAQRALTPPPGTKPRAAAKRKR